MDRAPPGDGKLDALESFVILASPESLQDVKIMENTTILGTDPNGMGDKRQRVGNHAR
jgi:hypothetical protein